MKCKFFLKVSVTSLLLITLNACAFIPKTITTTTHNSKPCTTVTSEWTIEVVTFDSGGIDCGHSEGCAMVILAVPLVTAAVSFPIVIIGSIVNSVEKQFRCD